MEECKREYYPNGNIYCKSYYVNEGKYHREDGPAQIYYYISGEIESERYFKKEVLHRENGPAIIQFYKNGKIRNEHYYINGKPHREDGPARIWLYQNGNIQDEYYYLNGIFYSNYEDKDITDNWKVFCSMQIFR